MTTPERVAECAAKGLTKTQVSRELGIPRTTVRRHWPKENEVSHSSPSSAFAENADGTATTSAVSAEPIRTLADAVRVADVDLAVWYVERWECTAWTVGVKVGDPPTVVREQQYRVKLYLRRIVRRAIADALDAIYGRLADAAPKSKPAKPGPAPGEPFLAVLGLFDVHFGKLAWASETGDNYDLKAAEAVYRNAVEDLIAERGGRGIQRWILPIGNDFYHIDNSRNSTFAGTPQDTDGRYAKVIEAGEMAVIWAVERLIEVAPVSVVWVPGNHDPTTSYHLARTVAAWFRKATRVSVDYGPSPRKYVHWNGTLLGLTHGNEERHDSLPSLMATERPREWSQSACREWLLGHMHRSRQWQTKPVDTYEGTVIRVLRSLTGTDAWHHRKGYVGASKAAECYFYGRDRGYAGHAVVPARTV